MDSTNAIQDTDSSRSRNQPTGAPPAKPPLRQVCITINGTSIGIAQGRHSVAELKRLGSVPECDELAEVKAGRLHPLPDNGFTHIEGGEKFLSSPRSCPAS